MTGRRPDRPTTLTRADLPDQITAETVRQLPIATLRRLAGRKNDILSPDEQQTFDTAVREVMRDSAERMSQRFSKSDLPAAGRAATSRLARGEPPSSRADQQLDRLVRRIGQQIDLAETLAPDVDWSFAQAASLPVGSDTNDAAVDEEAQPTSSDDGGTISDLEDRITDQVELIEVMNEIAEVSRRTYSLEQQRDLQSTRTVFFGLVVSAAVLVAGWAPLVAAEDWSERLWIVVLTLGTCVLAGAVYGVVRLWQGRARDNGDGD